MVNTKIGDHLASMHFVFLTVMTSRKKYLGELDKFASSAGISVNLKCLEIMSLCVKSSMVLNIC